MKNPYPNIFFIPFVFNIIKPFWKWIIAQFVVAIIWAVDLSLRPLLIKIMLDKVSNIEPLQALDVLWKPAFFYIVMSVFVMIVFRFYDWISLNFNPNLKKHICLLMLQIMMKHSHSFYQDHFAGSLTNKVNDIIEGTTNIVKLLVEQFFSHILALVLAVYTIWQVVGAKFALAPILWVVLFLIVSWQLSRIAKKLSDEAAEVKSGVIGYIVDILSNMLNIRLFSKRNIRNN